MVRFYGVMLHMSIEPCHLGGYEDYFKPTSYARVGHGYNVKLVGYGGWAGRIITLACFFQIRPAFHPEAGNSAVGNRCHQLSYLIRSVNNAASNNFDPGPTVAFG